MKVIIAIFSLSYSLNVYCTEWIKVTSDAVQTNYINNKSIKKNNGNISFVRLADFSRPNEYGRLSALISMKAQCSPKKIMYISYDTFKLNMARGKKINTHKVKKVKWIYTKSKDYKLKLVEHVCNFFN